MNSKISILIMIVSAILAAFSQVLLKSSSNENKSASMIESIFKVKVIIAYGILLLTMFLNIVAYKYLPYKIGPIISTLTYVFVLIFSRYFFNEKITKNILIGSVLIIIGIVIYNI